MLNISSNQMEFTKQTLGMVIEAPMFSKNMRKLYFDHVQKDRKNPFRGGIRSFSGVVLKKHKTDLF